MRFDCDIRSFETGRNEQGTKPGWRSIEAGLPGGAPRCNHDVRVEFRP